MDIVDSNNNLNTSIISDELDLLIKLKKDLVTEVYQLKLTLESKQNMLKNITNFIYKKCPHEFEDDFFSTGNEEIEHITYCRICEEDQR